MLTFAAAAAGIPSKDSDANRNQPRQGAGINALAFEVGMLIQHPVVKTTSHHRRPKESAEAIDAALRTERPVPQTGIPAGPLLSGAALLWVLVLATINSRKRWRHPPTSAERLKVVAERHTQPAVFFLELGEKRQPEASPSAVQFVVGHGATTLQKIDAIKSSEACISSTDGNLEPEKARHS